MLREGQGKRACLQGEQRRTGTCSFQVRRLGKKMNVAELAMQRDA